MRESSPLVLAIPTFNSEVYLADTLQSLAANGATLRWWLQDGGSTDGTIEIARAFSRCADSIISEFDNGQADALNRAFRSMDGEIVGFINSDDRLAPNAASSVLEYFAQHPEVDLVYGEVEWIDQSSDVIGHHAGRISNLEEILDIYHVWWKRRNWVQPEVFFRRTLWERVGGFNESLQLAFDFEFWVRCFEIGARVARIPQVLAQFRLHPLQKSTAAQEAANEIRDVVSQRLPRANVSPRFRRRVERLLSYDRYQSGQDNPSNGERHSFSHVLLKNPKWLLLPTVLRRLQQNSFVRPGRWLYLLHSYARRNPRALFHENLTLPKISRWRCPEYPSAGSDPEVHLLLGESTAFLALWMLASWHHTTELRWSVVLHDDGTLTDRSTDAFRTAFADLLRIIRRPEADATMAAQLATKPYCRRYREQHPLALKIFDVPSLARAPRLILLDSDLLFFRRPERLLQWIADTEAGCWFNEDVADRTLLSGEEAERCLGVRLWPRINSGLCLLWKDQIDLEFCERALAETTINRGHQWRIEQTLFALCASRSGRGGLLPPAYEVSLGKFVAPDVVARHYVGAVRDRFYAEGLPRVAPIVIPRGRFPK